MRLTDFLPCIVGSEQRPHQKTQSLQCKTSEHKLDALEDPLKTFEGTVLRKEKRGEKQYRFVNIMAPPKVFK
jgi:hypothetical protein